jgi:hypothetical protein
MPILLLLVVPAVLTLGLVPLVRRRVPVQRLAALVAFVVAVGLTSLFAISEWRESYGGWKLAEAGAAVLLSSSLVALLHWAIWSLALRFWRRRGRGGKGSTVDERIRACPHSSPAST